VALKYKPNHTTLQTKFTYESAALNDTSARLYTSKSNINAASRTC